MAKLLGIDLGTSSVKAVVVDETGRVLGTGSREIGISTPQPGWAEQDPAGWWTAARTVVRAAMARAGTKEIDAIGLSGQMHGTVLLDRSKRAIRPAILWADRRSAPQAARIREALGSGLMQTAGTAPAAGFTVSSLLWLKENEPESLEQAATCILPKDYLRLLLTGNTATDETDASGTGMFDIDKRQWSAEIVERVGLPEKILPYPLPSYEVAGRLTAEAATSLGLRQGIPVVAGSADQPAQATGNGLIEPGSASLTVGTGGQLFITLAQPLHDPLLRLHVFCHAPSDRWYMLGAMLAAGLSLRWLRDMLDMSHEQDAYKKLDALATEVGPGADSLLFLPYLTGERAPVMDPSARGAFVGLTLEHGRGHVARAVMEGVAFALRQIMETAAETGARIDRLVASGNGLASPLWRQIVADVINVPLHRGPGPERAAVGAALLAGIGVRIFSGFSALPTLDREESEVTEPDPERAALYAEYYRDYLQLYPSLRSLTGDISKRAAQGQDRADAGENAV